MEEVFFNSIPKAREKVRGEAIDSGATICKLECGPHISMIDRGRVSDVFISVLLMHWLSVKLFNIVQRDCKP